MSMKITVTLSQKEVEQAISEWLLNQKLKAVSFTFNTTMSYDQFDRGPGTPKLSSITVEVNPIGG